MQKNLKKIIFHIVSLAFFMLHYTGNTQSTAHEIPASDNIKTIQLHTHEKFSNIPFLKLGESFRLSFDDVNGDEADYYYRVLHYNFDWTPSSLYKNEYLDGFDEIRITSYENSFNTLKMYSHYVLNIPNEDTRRLKVSGNYIIEVYNDDDEIVFSKKLIVYEPLTTVKVAIKRSRDLKYVDTKQVVQFEISSRNILLRNPQKTVKTLVIQNNDLNTAITDLIPQYMMADKLVYNYDQEASFWASNEFLYFDSKDIRASNINTSHIDLKELYHNYLYTDKVRGSNRYLHNPDIDGNFVIRNLDADDQDIEADYVWMHFSLRCEKALNEGKLYIYGNFNNYTLDDSTLLKYDPKNKTYVNNRLFKQGFYNYKYVLLKPDGSIDLGFISGNFDETENEYTVIPYYRPPGSRYDKVIGKGVGNSSQITN